MTRKNARGKALRRAYAKLNAVRQAIGRCDCECYPGYWSADDAVTCLRCRVADVLALWPAKHSLMLALEELAALPATKEGTVAAQRLEEALAAVNEIIL